MSRKRREFLRAGGALLAASALAACASPPANYYRIAVIPGAIRGGGPNSIGIRSVSIPGYLSQNGIAKPSSGYEFAAYSNNIWAEPLAGMLQGVMVQDLSQRLPGSTVLGSGGSIGVSADLLVEINVLNFDPDSSGRVTLNAQIAIRSGITRTIWQTRNFQQSANAAGQEALDIVTAMSTLWAAASDQVAALILESWAAQSTALSSSG